MPTLDWNKFEVLAGSRSQNFENLSRGLMRLHFEGYGEFRALKNQPGVEFHLKLAQECATLGSPPRWWGWQCKYYELTAAGDLRSASRTKIEESLRKTEKYLPEITDWVLWTPYTLSKKDQDWFYELGTKMDLHLWAVEEVDTYLGGPGTILRSTYFGELVATVDELALRHREAIQPIKKKWFEPVHQVTESERSLRRMLGEPGSWSHLIETGQRLKAAAETITDFTSSTSSFPKEMVEKFVQSCETFAEMLLNFHEVLADGDLEIIQQQLRERQTLLEAEVKATVRHLRRFGVAIALDATNALYDMRTAQRLLNEVEDFLGVSLVAVLADAGGGKTQLSASLTAPQSGKPAGILLHGRKLHRGNDLDDLARGYALNGKPLESFEQLLAALDAAAKRLRCRLPIVIDGLNEAENPKDWLAPLASLSETVKAYPNVLVTCTLRTGERERDQQMWDALPRTNARESFAERALPKEIRRIESDGFGGDTDEAIVNYFEYFKIDPGDAEIPHEFLQHPLTLRIFCQATNPEREETVSVDYFPAALASLFEKYIEHSAARITELSNLSHSYTSEDVHAAIYRLGIMLWDQRTRAIDEKDFREAVGDATRDWDSSVVNLLAQEGLIFRDPGKAPHEYVITPSFDALGGIIIARSLLTRNAQDSSFAWLSEAESVSALMGEDSHELASDIFRALVALTPRKFGGIQLWKVAPEIFRNGALRFATASDPEYLDQETISALLQLIGEDPKERSRFYSRLNATRAAHGHPLNAEFLDKVLRPIKTVGERDLSWTEWIRKTRSERFSDILAQEERWKSILSDRKESDGLRLKWLMWHLTSSDRELRDVTTRAIYWFGRGDPLTLFKETIKSLDINDPYVPERMLAASYGVAMALRGCLERASFTSEELPQFARQVYESIFSEEAAHSTTHILLREYAVRIVELACFHDSTLFTAEEIGMATAPFEIADLSEWDEKENPADNDRSSRAPSPFQMDFENYTLGRLVPDRGNYDYNHAEYKKTKARILWRIEQLGWFTGNFEEIDRSIAHDRSWRRIDSDSKKTDRYGKKYSWIAYFEMSGLLHDLGLIDRTYERERTSDVDIDPSFPVPVQKFDLFKTDLLGDPDMSMPDWIATGEQPDMAPYLKVGQIKEHEGSWIALDGFVVQEDEGRERRSFCFIKSFIVKNEKSEAFLEHLSEQELGGRWLPEKPSVIYTFAGEIPWSVTYPRNELSEFSFVENERTVKVENTVNEFYLEGRKLDISSFYVTHRKLFGTNPLDTDGNELSDAEIENIKIRKIPVEIEEVQQDFAEYEALIPVCHFGWEGHQSSSSEPRHANTLAKEIAEDLELVNCPQEFDIFTKDGNRASLNISDHSEDYNNSQSFFFIRENLLRQYLDQNDSTLVWVIWGEREYSSKQAMALSRGSNRPEQTHGDIKEVRRYEP